MSTRKIPLVNNEIYHVFNRSISHYKIFNNDSDYLRMLDIINLFQYQDFAQSYSNFIKLTNSTRQDIKNDLEKNSQKIVDIIAFCLMPTHIHLILKQNVDHGISVFMARVLNSYSRYFNTIHRRKGPLWEGHFLNVLIDTDELILHITRYLHLNPVTAKIIDRPEDWKFSSYMEYINRDVKGICNFSYLIDMTPLSYKKFVNDQIAYQRELAKIKHLLLDDYSG